MAEELKDTLNLPVTDFPMRAGLAEREPLRIAHWEKNGLYAAIQKRAAAAHRVEQLVAVRVEDHAHHESGP
jgi:isoleucyl-tRNA synthetase